MGSSNPCATISAGRESVFQVDVDPVRSFLDGVFQLRGLGKLVFAGDQILSLRSGLADICLTPPPAVLGDGLYDLRIVGLLGYDGHTVLSWQGAVTGVGRRQFVTATFDESVGHAPLGSIGRDERNLPFLDRLT